MPLQPERTVKYDRKAVALAPRIPAVLKALRRRYRFMGSVSASMSSVDRSTTKGAGSNAIGASSVSAMEGVFKHLGFEGGAILLLISAERLSYEDGVGVLAMPLTVVAKAEAAARNAFDAMWNTVNASDKARVK